MYIGLRNGTRLATIEALEDSESLLGIGIEIGKARALGDPFTERLWLNRAQLVLDQIAKAMQGEGYEDYTSRHAGDTRPKKSA